MLSAKRYKTIAKIMLEHGYAFSEADIALYADMFEIIAVLTNNKLNDLEMFEAFDFLSDLILDKKFKYAIFVPKKDRIKVQLRLMEEIPQTAGKLTQKEKEALAFCVFYATCICVYDEESAVALSGLVDFVSVEKIENLIQEYKAQRPALFVLDAEEDTEQKKEDYGYTLSNPIVVTSIPASYQYLDRLRMHGKPVEYIRLGCCAGKNGHLIDEYEISAGSGAKVNIFIDPYGYSIADKAPKGFSLES